MPPIQRTYIEVVIENLVRLNVYWYFEEDTASETVRVVVPGAFAHANHLACSSNPAELEPAPLESEAEPPESDPDPPEDPAPPDILSTSAPSHPQIPATAPTEPNLSPDPPSKRICVARFVLKPRLCESCGISFTPRSGRQRRCSPFCKPVSRSLTP